MQLTECVSTTASTPARQQEAAVQYQQIWLPIANRHIDRTNRFTYFYIYIYFVYVAYTTIVTNKKSTKINHKIFLIIAKNDRYLQLFMLVTDWQPIGGIKCCCSCD